LNTELEIGFPVGDGTGKNNLKGCKRKHRSAGRVPSAEEGGWFSFSSALLPAHDGSNDLLVCAPWQ